jgi:hypothetical protein
MRSSTRLQRLSGAKFFRRGESFAVVINTHAKTHARGARCDRSRGTAASRDVKETRISSTFIAHREFFACDCIAEEFFRRALCRRSANASVRARGRGTYTQN